MKALQKTQRGVGHLELVEVSIPEIEDDEVLVKVWASGICGSDLLIQDDKHFYEAPVTLGHEYAGIAEKVGPKVTKVKPGDRIVADIETRTGWLGVTRNGGFASYMSIPQDQIYVYPDGFSLDHMCWTEPVVAPIHSMQERNNVRAGDFVVVAGPGPMGLLGVQFAKLRGASTVVLIGLHADEERLKIGKKVGADYILYSEDAPEKTVMELSHGRGADFVLECSASAKGVQHAIDCARRAPEGPGGKGVIAFISLWGEPVTLNLDPVSLYQISINGAWSWNGTESWERAVNLISRGVFDLDSLVTNRYDLDDWESAFNNLRSKKDVKALIYPNGRDWA